jgi:hypothetical protein
MASYLDNPQLWRDRAEEARTMAEGTADADARRIMLSIAQNYEELAERAEQRLGLAPRGRH